MRFWLFEINGYYGVLWSRYCGTLWKYVCIITVPYRVPIKVPKRALCGVLWKGYSACESLLWWMVPSDWG